MTARAYALVFALGLPIAAGTLAATTSQMAAPERAADATAETIAAPGRWIPKWLAEPLSRAIADATDPRDRKAK